MNRPEETQEIILEQENNFESDSSNTFFEEGNGRVEHDTSRKKANSNFMRRRT